MNLIVSDFDGTFFDKNYMENIEFINSNRKEYDFVIATGRSINSLKKDLKINCNYYICNDGGYILDKYGNLLYRNEIESKTVKTILSRIKELEYQKYYFDDIMKVYDLPVEKTNKIAIKKEKDINIDVDLSYIINGLNDIYGYISNNWINIISNLSSKESAIEFINNLKHYDKIYVIGNDINDYNMIEKYNGYLISNEKKQGFKCINNFLELKDIIKNDQ